MIRITQQDSAGAAKTYYATADYYSEGQEIVGSWGGKGASQLGLEGTVDKFSFERLCDNLDPRTGKPLTVRTRSERRVGFDFTFSVPKSVSLLYAMSGDQDILGAFRAAVDETMREIEAEMKTRVRKGRQDTDRTTGNMVWSEFIHTTSRPVDGIPDPDRKAELGAETREKKETALSWESLRKEWNTRLSDKERRALAAVHRRERAVARPERGEGLAVDHALEHSFVREAVVPERKLVTEALKRGIGAVTVEGVTQEMRDRPLIRSDVAGRRMATTKEMLTLESKL